MQNRVTEKFPNGFGDIKASVSVAGATNAYATGDSRYLISIGDGAADGGFGENDRVSHVFHPDALLSEANSQ